MARRKARLIFRRAEVMSSRMPANSGEASSRMLPLASNTASMASMSSSLGSWPATTASRRGQGSSELASTWSTWFMVRDAAAMRRNASSSRTLSRTPSNLISRCSSSNSSMGQPTPPCRMRAISSVSCRLRTTQERSLLGTSCWARASLLGQPESSASISWTTSNSRSSATRASK